MYQTSGPFMTPLDGKKNPGKPVVDPGLIGIVTDELDAVARYLDLGPVGPYTVIRKAEDVPERLGGLAILNPELLSDGLRDALAAAVLGGKGNASK